jgi:hypothetical protein
MSYEMEYLIQAPFIGQHALTVGFLGGSQPEISGVSNSRPDRLKRFHLIVLWPRRTLDGGTHATGPSAYHVRNVGHRPMRRAQTESIIPSALVIGKPRKEIDGLKIAPDFVFYEIEDCR